MEAKLGRPRAIMYGSLAIMLLAASHWLGWWILLPLVGSVLGYALLRPLIATSKRPEYVVAATVVNAQVLIGVGIALTGGPTSPAIPLLLLPVVTLPVRFSARGDGRRRDHGRGAAGRDRRRRSRGPSPTIRPTRSSASLPSPASPPSPTR